MLIKDLISTYGASFAGNSAPHNDPIWHLGQSEELQEYRRYALDVLKQAKVYLLDHAAAAYADTLHETMQKEGEDRGVSAWTLLGEIKLPADVVWVEFDYRELVAARVLRDATSIADQKDATGSGLRGFLIDNRAAAHLRIAMFRCDRSGKVIDPFFTLRFERSGSDNPGDSPIQWDDNRYMASVLSKRGMAKEKIDGLFQMQLIETGSDLFIPYALFAMLVSPDLGGIIPTPEDTFSPKDVKTARKFGKIWILGAPKSHLTIRIGPQAAAHMQERRARLEFERQEREGRTGPIRHWVSEHERHYRNGKVVLIKGHHRGHEPGPGLPTRVMGPRLGVAEFLFSPSEQSRD